MSVLCCNIPHFLITVAQHHHPEWQKRPLALLDEEEQVCAVSVHARSLGVGQGMSPRQAQLRCPDVLLQPLNLSLSQAKANQMLAILSSWELPVENVSWGCAFVDLQQITGSANRTRCAEKAAPLVREMGGQLRPALDPPLLPALGWDSGKFTAQVAARKAAPGKMRLVEKANEKRFLSPLSIKLLPLAHKALRRLHWLGIRTLGQYAELPYSAVQQQFGREGLVAQQWAQGRDDRPVLNTAKPLFEPVVIELDPPVAQIAPAKRAIMKVMQTQLEILSTRVAGVRHVDLRLSFVDGAEKEIRVQFIHPQNQPHRLEAALHRQLSAVSWPGELLRVDVTRLEEGALSVEQLPLFSENREFGSQGETLKKLSRRYGNRFWSLHLYDRNHPVAERRFSQVALKPESLGPVP